MQNRLALKWIKKDGGWGGRGKNTFNKIYLVQDLSISLEKFWQILHQLIDGIQTSLFVHCCWFVQHRLGNCLSWQVFYGCRQVQRRKNTEKGTQKPWCKQHNAVDLKEISAGNRILFHFIKFFLYTRVRLSEILIITVSFSRPWIKL